MMVREPSPHRGIGYPPRSSAPTSCSRPADDAPAGVRDLLVGQRLVQRLEVHRVSQRSLALGSGVALVDVEQGRLRHEGAGGDCLRHLRRRHRRVDQQGQVLHHRREARQGLMSHDPCTAGSSLSTSTSNRKTGAADLECVATCGCTCPTTPARSSSDHDRGGAAAQQAQYSSLGLEAHGRARALEHLLQQAFGVVEVDCSAAGSPQRPCAHGRRRRRR